MLDVKKWMAKVTDALSKTPSWGMGTDVYWWQNSWTCPSNGFIEIYVEPSASNWYLRISDSSMPDTGWSHRMAGSNTQSVSQTVFVKKGAVLKTHSLSGISAIHVWYFPFNKVGG